MGEQVTSVAARDEGWQTHAACAGADTRTFFTTRPAAAKEICRGCPVRPECLYDALDANAPNGIWGGLTRGERLALPELPRRRAAALVALREHLDAHEPGEDLPTERTAPTMTITTPESAVDPKQLTTSALLRWAGEHTDPGVRDEGARAEAALTGLHSRYIADQELTAITDEAAQLEKRLAELRAREAELAPSRKTKRKTGTYVRDYEPRTVRAWAADNGIECPRVGQIPKRVLEAWRASQTPSGGEA